MAAYGFDEGSGTTTADQSGNGNGGTLANTTWSTAGKYGKALSFNGTNAMVTVADSNSLDLTTGMTIEGWVNPANATNWRTLLVKERPGDLVYGLYSSTDANRPQSQVTIGSTARLLDGTSHVPAATWTHVAATFDATTQRLFVNGTQVSSLAASGTITTSTSPLRIGGNTIWSEWFSGLIDEVRVYNRALTATEIQTDMSTSISSPDAQAPSAPRDPDGHRRTGQVALSWGAATDNVGVTRYDVHRSTSAGFTPKRREPDRAADRHELHRPRADAGHLLLQGGRGGRRRQPRAARERGHRNRHRRHDAADGTDHADRDPVARQVSLAWSGATDAGGIARYNVHRSTTSGFTPSAANRIAQPTGTSYVDSGLTGGTYYYRVTAVDNAGNEGAPSPQASATVPTGPPAGLVGEWGFDAGIGTTAADSSGTGNTGTIGGPTWTTTGKFGSALTFDGVNDIGTVADANNLDLTTAMTLEAWVRPTALGNAWRTTLMKERSRATRTPSTRTGRAGRRCPPARSSRLPSGRGASAQLAASAWTHIAVDVQRHNAGGLRQRRPGRASW